MPPDVAARLPIRARLVPLFCSDRGSRIRRRTMTQTAGTATSTEPELLQRQKIVHRRHLSPALAFRGC